MWVHFTPHMLCKALSGYPDIGHDDTVTSHAGHAHMPIGPVCAVVVDNMNLPAMGLVPKRWGRPDTVGPAPGPHSETEGVRAWAHTSTLGPRTPPTQATDSKYYRLR